MFVLMTLGAYLGRSEVAGLSLRARYVRPGGLVAFRALYALVLAFERIFGLVMVELLLVKLYHPEGAALVVGVTLYAGLFECGMEPLIFIYLFCELIVAVKTPGVGQPAAKHVTFRTVLNAFVFCMGTGKLTGTNERTKPVGCRSGRKTTRSKTNSKNCD